jgi:lincosamide nucleotidyltransferase A/C/D/E
MRERGASGSTPRAYRGREPSREMDAGEVVRVLDALGARGVTAWIDGGWGVDALLEVQTREHDDLDLVVELADAAAVAQAVLELGYEAVAGAPPLSFVLVDADGRQVDVHPVVRDREGGGVYRMDDGRDWVYPAQGFTGRGRVAGRHVRCLSPEVQVLVHDGYELAQKDYRELRLLHERFGVLLPDGVRARALGSDAPRTS